MAVGLTMSADTFEQVQGYGSGAQGRGSGRTVIAGVEELGAAAAASCSDSLSTAGGSSPAAAARSSPLLSADAGVIAACMSGCEASACAPAVGCASPKFAAATLAVGAGGER